MRTRSLLTAAAIFCRSLAWFPLCIILLSLRAEEDDPIRTAKLLFFDASASGQRIILPAFAVCGISFLTLLAARGIGERFLTAPRRALALKIAAAVPAALLSVLAVFLLNGSIFCGIVLTAAAVLLPIRKISEPPDTLFTAHHFSAFLTVTVITAMMLHLAKLPVQTGWYLTVTGTVSAVHLLLRNQFMLQRLVNRRMNVQTDVPRDILRGNLMMVAGMILLIAAVFLFREQLTGLLCWMRDTAAMAGWKLVELFIGKAEIPPEAVPEEAAELGEPMQMTAGIFGFLWTLLWIPTIAVAWIIWRNLLSDWFYAIRNLLARLLAFLRGERGARRRIPFADSEEYYDTETAAEKEPSAKQKKRSWRKQLRAWRSLPDTREKFYAGYQLLLRAPAWEQNELRQSDTVREIREKWLQHHTPQDALDAVTSAYHTDRYAEKGLPEQAVAELSAALDRLR